MLIKEEILREAFDDFRFADYPYNDSLKAVLQAMDMYAEEVLKIAAEKAKVTGERGEEYHYHFCTEDDVISVDKASILNCLK